MSRKPAHKTKRFALFVIITTVLFVLRKFARRAVKVHRTQKAQQADIAYLDTVSRREGCDLEGLRFLSGALSEDTIRDITRTETINPVRVYAGLAHGMTPHERTEYALAEMERLGGLNRSNILIVSPTGRGYVHPIPVESFELASRGDCAIVCVQYHDDRTMRAIQKLDIAAECHRSLVEAILARCEHMANPPSIYIYGESLGAWASQEGLLYLNATKLLSLSGGVWSGTPYASNAKPKIQSLLHAQDITAASEILPQTRFVFLTNSDDPIAHFSGFSLLYKSSPWVRRLGHRFVPGVTFARAVLEVEAATRPRPGVREAKGHDYRASVAGVIYKLLNREDQKEITRMEDFLTGHEQTRRQRMSFLRSPERE